MVPNEKCTPVGRKGGDDRHKRARERRARDVAGRQLERHAQRIAVREQQERQP